MPKYTAFLRAINVGGHVVKMDELRVIFSALKFSNVETFIASGNVIFETKAAADEKLERKIEKHLEAELGYEVGTFVRSFDEIRAISEHQAFSSEMLKKAFAVHVGIMRSAMNAEAIQQAKVCASDADDFVVHGREVYWLTRVSTNESKFTRKFAKIVGPAVTYRNVNTIQRLAKKYSH